MSELPVRVLVYQLGSIGDTIVTIPALKAVRRHYGPDARVCLLHETRPGLETTPSDLLSGGPEIDCFISYSLATTTAAKLTSALKVLWRLWRERFQVVIYLAPSERSAEQVRRDARFFKFSGIHQLVGFKTFTRDFLYPVNADGHPSRVLHEAECRLERLKLDGIDVSRESDLSKPFLRIPSAILSKTQEWLEIERKHFDRPLVAICPGSKQPANYWPEDRFTEIGRRLIQYGNCEVIVVGGAKEAQIGRRMVEAWNDGINAAGRLSVLESAAILGQCSLCIGLDTGTTHLAAASGTPCVALYGERDNQGRFEPLGSGHIVLRTKVPCAGCRLIETPCPLPEHPCMKGIQTEMVWEAILRILSNKTGE